MCLYVSKILLCIFSLLTNPHSDFCNPEAAALYMNNRYEYDKKAREWAIQYAEAPKNKNEFYYLVGKDKIDYELKFINDNKNYKLFSTNNLYIIKAIIESFKDSLYRDEKLELIFELPQEYPFKSPSFYFIKSHKYLKSTEEICNLILKEKWNYKLCIRNAIRLIYDYLDDNFINNMPMFGIVNAPLDKIRGLEAELNKEKIENKILMEKKIII